MHRVSGHFRESPGTVVSPSPIPCLFLPPFFLHFPSIPTNVLLVWLPWGRRTQDIKPENLLFTADGTMKLADFGHATTLPEEGRTLHPDVVTMSVGTGGDAWCGIAASLNT